MNTHMLVYFVSEDIYMWKMVFDIDFWHINVQSCIIINISNKINIYYAGKPIYKNLSAGMYVEKKTWYKWQY